MCVCIFSGLTIIVENLNRNRYLAHFRSVHRGAFFQELRTTEARQLQPDAWGMMRQYSYHESVGIIVKTSVLRV